MCIEILEVQQNLLYQSAILGAKNLGIRAQSICDHIAVIAHQFQALDVEFLKHLTIQPLQRFFFSCRWHMDVQCVKRLAYTDLRFFASCTTKANDAHHQMRFVGEFLINQFLLDLRPVAEVDTERCILVDATYQVLVQFFCQEGHKWREQGEQGSQALIKCQICRQFV